VAHEPLPGAYRPNLEIFRVQWLKAVGRYDGPNIGKVTVAVDDRPSLQSKFGDIILAAVVCFFGWMIVGWPLWNLVQSLF